MWIALIFSAAMKRGAGSCGHRLFGCVFYTQRGLTIGPPLCIFCVYTTGRKMDSKTVIKELKKAGWKHVRTKGSHHHFKHPEKSGLASVPHPKKEVSIGVLKSLERITGLALRK